MIDIKNIGVIVVVLILLGLGIYWLYNRNKDTSKSLTGDSCTPTTVDEKALDYKLNTNGECVISNCVQNFIPNDTMKKCIESEYSEKGKTLTDFQSIIKNNLLTEAENRTFVTKEEIEGADIVAITNSFLNKCPTPDDEQNCFQDFPNYCTDCVKDFIEYCDNNPTDTTNPITGLDCDYIVDERLGDACLLGNGCKEVNEICEIADHTNEYGEIVKKFINCIQNENFNDDRCTDVDNYKCSKTQKCAKCNTILKKCKDSSCVYIPETNSAEECSQAGVTCTQIQRKCTETPTLEDDKKYCF